MLEYRPAPAGRSAGAAVPTVHATHTPASNATSNATQQTTTDDEGGHAGRRRHRASTLPGGVDPRRGRRAVRPRRLRRGERAAALGAESGRARPADRAGALL